MHFFPVFLQFLQVGIRKKRLLNFYIKYEPVVHLSKKDNKNLVNKVAISMTK